MNRIKELRENIGLSQEKLSKNLSINLRTLQRWENDETAIRKKNAEKIGLTIPADVLNGATIVP